MQPPHDAPPSERLATFPGPQSLESSPDGDAGDTTRISF